MKTPAGRTRLPIRMLGPGPGLVWLLVAGGVLWMVHGYFRFIMPYGPDSAWREDVNYSPIVSTELFLLYNSPGVAALLLTDWATFWYLRHLPGTRPGLQRTARILAVLAVLFGLIAAIGLAVLFVPPTTGGISLGVPLLGLALLLAGLYVHWDRQDLHGHSGFVGRMLVILGLIGMFTLPVQPLIYALALLPPAVGTAVFALFGAGWVAVAINLSSVARSALRE